MKRWTNRTFSQQEGLYYYNVMAEATYKILKTEFVYQMAFQILRQLQIELFVYVSWFNNHRINGTLGYLTPVQSRPKVKKVVRISVDNSNSFSQQKELI